MSYLSHVTGEIFWSLIFFSLQLLTDSCQVHGGVDILHIIWKFTQVNWLQKDIRKRVLREPFQHLSAPANWLPETIWPLGFLEQHLLLLVLNYFFFGELDEWELLIFG